MTSLPAYERDPYRTEIDATVLRAGSDSERPFAVLDDTILYPEGGGQPADRGTLNGVAVLDVQKRAGEVRHYLERPVEPGPAAVRLDWRRRFDHMQQHTGQHLLSAVAQDRFGWETTAFHLGESVCDVELAAPVLPKDRLSELEEALAAEIRAARRVSVRRVPPGDLDRLPVRTRGLPEGHEGNVRLVEIAGVDLNTCGGTHLASTAEIELVKLLHAEALRGGTRLFFVCGGRARRRLGDDEERLAALRGAFGSPDAGLVAAARGKLEQLAEAERRARRLEDELAEAAADALGGRDGAVVDGQFDGKDLAFLQKTARRLASRCPLKAALLTATSAGTSCFALAVGEGLAVDVAVLGREIANLLDGRGGGSGRVFQGKAGSLDSRAAALALLEKTVAR